MSRRSLWENVRQQGRSMVEDVGASHIDCSGVIAEGSNSFDALDNTDSENVGNHVALECSEHLSGGTRDAADVVRDREPPTRPLTDTREGVVARDDTNSTPTGDVMIQTPPLPVSSYITPQEPEVSFSSDANQNQPHLTTLAISTLLDVSENGRRDKGYNSTLDVCIGRFENTGASLHEELAQEKQKNIVAEQRLLTLEKEIRALREENQRLVLAAVNVVAEEGAGGAGRTQPSGTAGEGGTGCLLLHSAGASVDADALVAKQRFEELQAQLEVCLTTTQQKDLELERKENRIRQLESVIASELIHRASGLGQRTGVRGTTACVRGRSPNSQPGPKESTSGNYGGLLHRITPKVSDGHSAMHDDDVKEGIRRSVSSKIKREGGCSFNGVQQVCKDGVHNGNALTGAPKTFKVGEMDTLSALSSLTHVSSRRPEEEEKRAKVPGVSQQHGGSAQRSKGGKSLSTYRTHPYTAGSASPLRRRSSTERATSVPTLQRGSRTPSAAGGRRRAAVVVTERAAPGVVKFVRASSTPRWDKTNTSTSSSRPPVSKLLRGRTPLRAMELFNDAARVSCFSQYQQPRWPAAQDAGASVASPKSNYLAPVSSGRTRSVRKTASPRSRMRPRIALETDARVSAVSRPVKCSTTIFIRAEKKPDTISPSPVRRAEYVKEVPSEKPFASQMFQTSYRPNRLVRCSKEEGGDATL